MRGWGLLAYSLFLAAIVLTIGVQLGIRHGRGLAVAEFADPYQAYDESALDAWMMRRPPAERVQKNTDATCSLIVSSPSAGNLYSCPP